MQKLSLTARPDSCTFICVWIVIYKSWNAVNNAEDN